VIYVEDAKEAQPGVWLELANGGGVLLREANAQAQALPQPRYSRQRTLKQLAEAQHSES
jgi:hypothetical protein